MRVRAVTVVGIVFVGSMVASSTPSRGSGGAVFEGTLPYPGGELTSQIGQFTGCPDGGPLKPESYVVIDFGEKSNFRQFRLRGPHYIINQPDPSGTLTALVADHDMDLYLFDDRCRAIQEHANNNNSDVDTTTKRPARYALINYYYGIHLDLPYQLEAKPLSRGTRPG